MAIENGSNSHASRLDKGKAPMVELEPIRGEDYGSEVLLSQVVSLYISSQNNLSLNIKMPTF